MYYKILYKVHATLHVTDDATMNANNGRQTPPTRQNSPTPYSMELVIEMHAVNPGNESLFYRRIEVKASFEPISMDTAFMRHYLNQLRDYHGWEPWKIDLKNDYLEFLWEFAGNDFQKLNPEDPVTLFLGHEQPIKVIVNWTS